MEQTPKNIALARLSFAASLLDLFIGLVIGFLLLQILESLRYPPYFGVTALLAGPVLYLIAREIIFGGHSIGKACLGLQVRPRTGNAPLAIGNRLGRLVKKLGSFGVPFLNVNRIPFYYDTKDTYLHSSLVRNQVSTPVSASDVWHMSVMDGPQAGLRLQIKKSTRFKQAGVVRIGRNPEWADLCLKQYDQISGKHCLVKIDNNQLYINDYGADGKGSSNGVYLGGKRLPVGTWVPFGTQRTFTVANARIGISR